MKKTSSAFRKGNSAVHARTLSYLKERIMTPEFQKEVVRLRKKYKISISAKSPEQQRNVSEMWIPEEWMSEASLKNKKKVLHKLAKEAADFLRGQDIPFPLILPSPFLDYIFLGKILVVGVGCDGYDSLNFLDSYSNSLIQIVDVPEQKRLYDVSDAEEKKQRKKQEKEFDSMFPISIRFGRNVSARQIADFVSKAWWRIDEMQQHYFEKKSRLGIAKNKNDKKLERSKLIYENRGKTSKEIARLANAQFRDLNTLTYSDIPKIIQSYERRMKDV